MRITRVHADAFGAMAGRTLELGPGLNVIVGPNESGKSTWHAALYAALCGVPPQENWTAGDERFAAFRRPRGGSAWTVRAEVEVDTPTGTRRVALAHDLLDPDATTVIDLDSGDDLWDEIGGEDGPDAARWLGFDRRSYAATSWIEQAGARSALVSVDGRNALQLAVAACIGEDEVDAALAGIEAARRDYIGGPNGNGAHAVALAAVRRWQVDRAAAEQIARTRQDALTRLASARGAAEIARKKLSAAKAFEARAEAEQLRASVEQADDPSAVVEEPVPPAGGTDRESLNDVEVHSTVALAELELREVEQAIADLDAARAAEAAASEAAAASALAGGSAVAGESAASASTEDTEDLTESFGGTDFDAVEDSSFDTSSSSSSSSPASDSDSSDSSDSVESTSRPRSGVRGLILDRIPALRQIWGAHRLPGMAWMAEMNRRTLLGIGALAALVTIVGVVLAISAGSIAALVLALLAAFVVLAVVAELTPGPAAPSAASDDPFPVSSPRPAAPARPVRERSSPVRTAPSPSSSPSSPAGAAATDLSLRYQVALTKLAATLIARGRRAHPLTAVADYDRYVLDCQEAAELRAQVDLAADQRRARQEEALRAREEVAERAERLADELEQAADPYDLSMPYRQSVADAERVLESAERDLELATAALAGVDHQVRARPPLADIEAGAARAEAAVSRVARLDRVLQRAHTELTLAREGVLRDIASGLTPRLTDYLAQFTDRPFSTVDTHDLQDRIGASLIRREPELGSFSTSETTFLFTRVALGQHLAGEAPQGPLLVDDITSSADTERIRRLLAIMRRIASQRQVVVFAHQSLVRGWAQKRIGKDPGIRLIRLTSIAEDPRQMSPRAGGQISARPKQATRGPVRPRSPLQTEPSAQG
jgi:hypothetical protein